MIFYDFEVFKYDWLVVLKDTDTRNTTVIVNNDKELKEFYEVHKNDIWVGYNSRGYDQFILKGILLDLSPQKINDHIIKFNNSGWSYSNKFNKINLYNYDCMTTFDSLKKLEGFMGNDIRETTVDFNINRPLTDNEMDEVVFYCKHDVEQTMEVFINRLEDFETHIALIKNFKLPLKHISKTKPQLSAIILGAVKQEYDDEFDITIVPTIKLNRYKHIKDWYLNHKDYNQNLDIIIAGIPHNFAWGGLHGARKQAKCEGMLINSDVGSFYPSLMIEYDFLSRNVKDKSKFKEIYDHRMKLKHEGKKKEQQPYKIVLNSTYGASKDKYNNLYDPRQANNVCINGQLMLLDLIEKIEDALPTAKLYQSNTDGVMWQLEKKEDLETYLKVCEEWSNRTKMKLDHDHIKKVIQKDVNNYIVVMQSGKIKSKGAYVKPLDKLDNDLPIVKKALMEYFINNVLVEETINNCNQLMEFQKIVKVSHKYDGATHGLIRLQERVLRVFASKDMLDYGVFKISKRTGKKEKIENTPKRCFINNRDIKNVVVPNKLDKQWYINMANKRIKDFLGDRQISLFG